MYNQVEITLLQSNLIKKGITGYVTFSFSYNRTSQTYIKGFSYEQEIVTVSSSVNVLLRQTEINVLHKNISDPVFLIKTHRRQ